MFWKKKKPAPAPEEHPVIAPMKNAITKQEAQNPYIRAQITGKEIVANLMDTMKDERGVRVETLLGALGSFAGFSTVYAMAKELEAGTLKAQMPEVAIVELKDGQTFFFGEYLNRQLLEDKMSLYNLTVGMAQHVGATNMPDLNELFKRTAGSIGSADFGHPALPKEHHPGDLPVNFAKYLYPKYLPVLARYHLPWIAIAWLVPLPFRRSSR